MKPNLIFAAGLLAAGLSQAAPQVTMERTREGFRFETIPAPALDDAAAGARLSVIDGRGDRNSAAPAVLVDGRLPTGEDQPSANFFFAQGSEGGRLRMDFAEPAEILSVASYSWHRGVRAPQVYKLWGNAEEAAGFEAGGGGWTLLGGIDTRRAKGAGNQHAVLVSDSAGKPLGRFRSLVFEVARSDGRDPFGHTFFSEIDVVTSDAPRPERYEAPRPVVKTFRTKDGKYRFVVDLTKAPDLTEWVEKELMPVVEEWYPKLVAMMPGEGFDAADTVRMEFKDDMGGTPAYAAGPALSLSIPFFRNQLQGEAKGCVIHELVHVVQSYGLARRNPDASPTPGWVTEGIADYVRWFLYEPESQGARITRRNFAAARYDGSYRISANFIDWVVRHHAPDLLEKLNTAAREGRYDEELWKKWTGMPLPELGAAWLDAHRRELGL